MASSQRRHQLDRVEGVGVIRRSHPVVHLERGIGALEGDIRQLELEGVIAIDIDTEVGRRAA